MNGALTFFTKLTVLGEWQNVENQVNLALWSILDSYYLYALKIKQRKFKKDPVKKWRRMQKKEIAATP